MSQDNELSKEIEPSYQYDDNSYELDRQRKKEPEPDIKETRLKNIKKQVDQRREIEQ